MTDMGEASSFQIDLVNLCLWRSADGAEERVVLTPKTFDILRHLFENAGRLVTRDELLTAVWRDVYVQPEVIKAHIFAIRNALGDKSVAPRFIETQRGRGYRFIGEMKVTNRAVASVSKNELITKAWLDAAVEEDVLPQALDDGQLDLITNVQGRGYSPVALAGGQQAGSIARRSNLPSALGEMMVGRDDVVLQIRNRLRSERLITILGPGGVGKTTVALAVGHAALTDFSGAVFFFDLAGIRSKDQIIAAIASTMGLVTQPGDPEEALLEFLRSRSALVILDGCEHVIEQTAEIADHMFRCAPDVFLLATSRAALQTASERVFRLQPLDCPPDQTGQTADDILSYAATRLFVQRVSARGVDLALGTDDAVSVAGICRRLDGMPLAIELAASRAAIFGVWHTATGLASHSEMLKLGRRTASPRHQTLRATLDWSHDFLSEIERVVLRCVSIFTGRFTLNAALAVALVVAQEEDASRSDVTDAVGSLVEKSLIDARLDSRGASYRLLDTTRAYALDKLIASGEHDSIATRHARYLIQRLEAAASLPAALASTEHVAWYLQEIENVRSALDWAFSPTGDAELGIALTIAAVPLWMHLSLVGECCSRVEQALGVLTFQRARDGPREMKLHGALGLALLLTKGAVPETGASLRKALAIAEAVGDNDSQLRILWGLWADRNNYGEWRESLSFAERFRGLASQSKDPVDIAIGERMIGVVQHYIGDHATARRHFERMLALQDNTLRYDNIARFQFDPWVTARLTLSRILCIQGLVEQAMDMVERGVAEARTIDHATTLCNVLAKACPVALFARDLVAAERFILLLERAAMQGLSFWQAEGRGYRGVFHLMRGETALGVRLVKSAFDTVRQRVYTPPYPFFLGALAEGLSRLGETPEALLTADQAIHYCESHGEVWYLPELLRIKGEVSRGARSYEIAQELFLRALDLARTQGALLWELRSATSLARLWQEVGQSVEARELLGRTYAQFSEGFATPDLLEAKAVLSALGGE